MRKVFQHAHRTDPVALGSGGEAVISVWGAKGMDPVIQAAASSLITRLMSLTEKLDDGLKRPANSGPVDELLDLKEQILQLTKRLQEI